MWLIFVLTFLFLYLIYLKIKYFTLRGPLPGLKPQFLFGNLLQTGLLNGVSLPEIYTSLRNRLGDNYQLQFGFLHFIVIGDIDDIQYIFTHPHIYDQGDWFVDQLGALIPNALITLKGFFVDRNKYIHNNIYSNF